MNRSEDHRHQSAMKGEANVAQSRQDDDEILTIDDVSIRKRVPKSWVYARTRERAIDGIPHFKFGKYVRFTASDIDAYFAGLRRR